MNAQPAITRLLWKDYRLQRAFWICMMLFAMMLFAFVRMFMVPTLVEATAALFAIAIGVPAFYALGCGATMFSSEHETGTFDFQCGLPISPRKYFFVNMLFALLSIAAMAVLLFLIAIVVYTSPAWLSRETLPELPKDLWAAYFGVGGVGVLELFVWGVFFSLILKRPLISAILGVAVASIGVQLAITVPIFDASLSPYIIAVPGRLLIVVLVAVADIYLGCRWFRGEGIIAKYFHRKQKIQPVEAVAASRPIAAKRPRFFPFFLRLAWQQARQNAWIWIWFSIALVAFLALFYLKSNNPRGVHPLFVFMLGTGCIGTLIGLPLIGVNVFYPDQQRRMYQFYAERGARPGYYWWSRQLTGFAIPCLLGLLFYLAVIVPENIRSNYPLMPFWEYANHRLEPRPWTNISLGAWLAQFGMVFNIVLIIYSVGQFWAMFTRSGILAMLFSLILTVALFFWTFMMLFWDVPWWWSIAPWPLLLLLATRLKTSAWLQERRSLGARLIPALVFLPMLAILIAVPFFRVFSVPLVDPGFSPEEFQVSLKPSPEALKTVAMYQEASREIRPVEINELGPVEKDELSVAASDEPQPDNTPDVKPWRFDQPLSEYQRVFLKKNQKAIELALEASKRPECEFYADHPETFSRAALDTLFLLDWVVCQAQLLENEGQLDAAWEHYLGALRIARHIENHVPTTQFDRDTGLSIYAKIVGWTARPGQTPERIRAAIKQFEQLPVNSNRVLDGIKRSYLVNRGLLSEIHNSADNSVNLNLNLRLNKGQAESLAYFAIWQRFLPWEKARALRMLNVLTSQNLLQAENWLRLVEIGSRGGVTDSHILPEPRYALKEQIELPLISVNANSDYWLFNSFRYRLAGRNAALVSMALQAWKLEHGAWPKTLDELVGSYFEKIPLDPFNGLGFRYLPDGLSHDLKGDRDNGVLLGIFGMYDYNHPHYLPAKQPFLWSIGSRIVDFGGEDDQKPTLVRYGMRRNLYNTFSHENPTSETQVWSSGLIFPLP